MASAKASKRFGKAAIKGAKTTVSKVGSTVSSVAKSLNPIAGVRKLGKVVMPIILVVGGGAALWFGYPVIKPLLAGRKAVNQVMNG